MPSPPIQLFLTTIASHPALRQRQEYILRILQVKKIPFSSYDLASDEQAKRLWKRKAPLDKQQLPGILVGGRFPGTYQDFEEAVEYNELDIFLRLKETWDPEIDGDVLGPPVQPIGVPGASSPSQMTNHKPSYAPPSTTASPTPINSKNRIKPGDKEYDLGDELSGFGLQGVKVTDDELADLVKDLGLEGEEAASLVQALGGGKLDLSKDDAPEEKEEAKAKEEDVKEEKEEAKEEKEEKVEPASTSVKDEKEPEPDVEGPEAKEDTPKEGSEVKQ